MRRFFFLTLLRPLRVAWVRRLAPKAHTPSSTPRRDFIVRGLTAIPIALVAMPVASVGFGTLSSCAPEDGATLGSNETEVDSFTIGHTSEDGMTLEEALNRRADELRLEIYIAEATYQDAYDCRQTYSGRRLLRWDIREGSSTDTRNYRFIVRDENGDLIGNVPSLETILLQGYTVTVLESLPASDVATF